MICRHLNTVLYWIFDPYGEGECWKIAMLNDSHPENKNCVSPAHELELSSGGGRAHRETLAAGRVRADNGIWRDYPTGRPQRTRVGGAASF